MNREDIIRMAKEVWGYSELMTNDLANAYDMGVANEREACAEIAEKQRYAMNISLTSHPVQNGTAVGIANAIRARAMEKA